MQAAWLWSLPLIYYLYGHLIIKVLLYTYTQIQTSFLFYSITTTFTLNFGEEELKNKMWILNFCPTYKKYDLIA